VIRVLVSACLLGEKVRYNGAAASSSSAQLARWLSEGRVVPFCPEVAGGFGVPRPAAEIDGRGRVMTQAGADVTDGFRRGAQLALDAARAHNVRVAVLKDGSPSCASDVIHDGSFSGRKRPGQGVTAALLERHGIRVFSELRVDEAAAYLETIEDGSASHITNVSGKHS
jgi:uncharacterized protein YbbK (DUF523 family)